MAPSDASSSSARTSSLDDIRAARIEKAQQLRDLGFNPYAYRWESSHRAADLQSKYKDLPPGEEIGDRVQIAGRIMARRAFGKLAFFEIRDESGS
ncbi:MAG: lysine--tRNA ligase, partial [Cyanobacteria bacterium P01_H01_bin.15]